MLWTKIRWKFLDFQKTFTEISEPLISKFIYFESLYFMASMASTFFAASFSGLSGTFEQTFDAFATRDLVAHSSHLLHYLNYLLKNLSTL